MEIFGSLTFHELMLLDAARVNPFKLAIERTGKDHPGLVCVDIGSGLGTLALFCAKFGSAKRIYAIEQKKSIFKLSKEVARAQEGCINNKIKFLHGRSFDLELPEKADLLITETIGSIGIEEKLVSIINDAKKRFLHKDAIIIPAELEFLAAPMESRRCHNRVSFWNKTRYGIDLSVISPHAASRIYQHRVLSKELLGKPIKIGKLKLDGADLVQTRLSLSGTCPIQRSGTLHGFAAWFRVRLYDKIYLSNDPLKKRTPFNWTQAFFPLPNSNKCLQKVAKGQKVSIAVKWDLASDKASWSCEVV
jgi:protein arginine N-methyltransferase 1